MWEEKTESGEPGKELKEEARGKWRGRERIGHRNFCYTLNPGFCSPKETDRDSGTVRGGPGLSRGNHWGSRQWSPQFGCTLGKGYRFLDVWLGYMLTIRNPCESPASQLLRG